MKVTIDQVGRVLVPKAIRDQLGLSAGTTLDLSMYGDGIHLAPVSRTAQLVRRNGKLVATSETTVSDDDVLGLIESIRR